MTTPRRLSTEAVLAALDHMEYKVVARREAFVLLDKPQPGITPSAVVLDVSRPTILQDDVVDALEAVGVDVNVFFAVLEGL